jgi:NAD(P)-dependent dehydrogenase (short-subunit alcohol dehydrogenase family)
MSNTCLVTGAGSGVGRAVAIALIRAHWNVALIGRREHALKETVALADAGSDSPSILICPCDIGDPEAVIAMTQLVLDRFGGLQALVNAAGTNSPRRSLAELTLGNYQRIVDTNLNGAYYCVQAFLPIMRQQHSGTIVNIISEAGKQASPKSGVAYVVSKFGMAGLTQSINAEERVNGIRSCGIFPGDIDTPILDLRPQPPSAEARQRMMQPEDIAACVMLAITLPPRAVVEELIVRPG